MADNKTELMELIRSTPYNKIMGLPEVKDKFVTNYDMAHGSGKGELAYQKNMIFFQQRLADASFGNVSSLSVYKVLIQTAIKGYDLDPTEGEVYMMPYDTAIELQKQAPYLVRRLKETKQIQECKPAQLIFDGDEFSIMNGIVVKHERKLESQRIKAGYVIMINAKGEQVCFIYTPENWNQWRLKSKQKDGANWTGGFEKQPIEAFLKTKIVLHACKEKCWASSRANITDDFFPEVEEQDQENIIDTEAESIETKAKVYVEDSF